MRGRGLKPVPPLDVHPPRRVAPHAGAWIETCRDVSTSCRYEVAPHAGAWIETQYKSLSGNIFLVAPHAGAWIETLAKQLNESNERVAPHAGAWIETPSTLGFIPSETSPPMRGRGLKRSFLDVRNGPLRRPPCGGVD